MLDLDLESSWHLANLSQPINIQYSQRFSPNLKNTIFIFLLIATVFIGLQMSLWFGGSVIEQRLPNIISQEGRKRTHGAGQSQTS